VWGGEHMAACNTLRMNIHEVWYSWILPNFINIIFG